jgi:pyrimidine deaminase RibD-like protein
VTEADIKLMVQAIVLAEQCKPKKDSIPKVGAVIAVAEIIIGLGRRGTGNEGDDQHAELTAIESVVDQTQLPRATLYTTLEPCTGEVRTKQDECCPELILQYGIKTVFIGILDPNQGVTGKGLSKLQESGVAIELFPPDKAQKIRTINAKFIRSQKSLGASIISPTDGEVLKTYETGGKQTVRFECLNAPKAADNFLFMSHDGFYAPQPGQFRHLSGKKWAIDAQFGTTGEHTLHIVTANELGRELVQYYRRVINLNLGRRERLKAVLNAENLNLLGGDYFGIQMTGLPKGFRSEASVTVTIAKKPAM